MGIIVRNEVTKEQLAHGLMNTSAGWWGHWWGPSCGFVWLGSWFVHVADSLINQKVIELCIQSGKCRSDPVYIFPRGLDLHLQLSHQFHLIGLCGAV